MISNCVHGVKYAVVGKDGVMEWKSQAGLLYADDVCLMANSEQDLKVIMEKVNECVVEYGLNQGRPQGIGGPRRSEFGGPK